MLSPLSVIPLTSSAFRRPEEAYLLTLDCLQQMDTAFDDIFNRIDNKAKEQLERLQKLQNKIVDVEAKIEYLRSKRKAVKVLAPATLPLSSKANEFKSSLAAIRTTTAPHTSRLLLSSFPCDIPAPEKLSMQPITVERKSELRFGEPARREGLGQIPPQVKTVGSLLLFNTTLNPYSDSVGLDPRDKPTKAKKVEESEVVQAAPPNFLQTMDADRQAEINYIPGFGEVADFDLPNMLPNLPGIFDDDSYESLAFDFTLPSQKDDVLPSLSLPTITVEEQNAPRTTLPDVFVMDKTPAQVPVPRPAPTLAPAQVSSSSTLVPPLASDTVRSNGNTPPPPPPPPNLNPPKENSAPTSPALPAAMDGRASLLESIRATGGTGKVKLRSVQERKMAQKKKKQEEKSNARVAPTGDMMDDLRNRLAGLRKGISKGSRAGDESAVSLPQSSVPAGFGSAMDRVSNLIPHSPTFKPPEPAAQDSNADWD